MKAVLLALALSVPSLPEEPSRVVIEPFQPFLTRFISDTPFRAQRIASPLPVRFGTEADTGVHNERWSPERVVKDLQVPLSKEALAKEGLSQEVRKVTPQVTEVFQFREEADSYLFTYRFTLRRGKWYLTRVVDESM